MLSGYEIKLKEVVDGLNEEEKKRLKAQGYTNHCFFTESGELQKDYTWHVKEGKKYDKINCGTSGYFMVERETGELYNIKGYGVPDKNKKIKADIGNIFTVAVAVLSTKRYNYLR